MNIKCIKTTSKELLEINEYIYIATNKPQELINIYKIGHTNNLNKKLSFYNTSQIEPYYYCASYKCHSANSLKNIIFSLIKAFKVKNEMYQIDFKVLNNIVKRVCDNDLKIVNKINNHIRSLSEQEEEKSEE